LALSLLALLGLVLFVGFVALGTWQVHRLAWKTALIAHVNARVHAPPVPAPGSADWADITAASAEYRHVRLSGTYLDDRQTRVWTATDKGSGYWILTPLRRDDGSIVLVNRGFAAEGWCDLKGHCPPPPTGEVTITGLLRISVPSGLFRHTIRPPTPGTPATCRRSPRPAACTTWHRTSWMPMPIPTRMASPGPRVA